MAKNKKIIERNRFERMFGVFKNNVLLHEVSIEKVGSFAASYDENVFNDFAKRMDVVKKFKKTTKLKKVVLSEADVRLLFEMQKKHPKQEQLFIKNTLVSIVSTLDFLFAKIFQYYYSENYEKLSIGNKSISFSDLKTITKIEDAQKFLINREVELIILQKGFKERMKILVDELDIKVPDNTDYIKSLNKLIKLRNLIVHNEGFADDDFINQYGDGKIKKGNRIHIDQKYLVDSLYLVYFIGGYILQETQFKLSKLPLKSENYIINDVAHDLLKKGQYLYLKQIFDYSKDHKFDDITRKMIVINFCLGLKNQKKSLEHINKVLETEDWSSVSETTHPFSMAIKILRSDHKEFYKSFEIVLKNKSIGKDELLDWALFSDYKNERKFKRMISKYFK